MREKFHCEECGKLYSDCKCKVYMSRHGFARIRRLPLPRNSGKMKQGGVQALKRHPRKDDKP